MEVLSLTPPDPLRSPCRSVGHASAHRMRSKGFESRVIYARIVTSLDMQSSISIVFPPRDVQASLRINGVKVSAYVKISRALKRHRTDAVMSEYIYVNTDRIKFGGPFVPFEIHLQDGRVLVCGTLRRGNGGNGVDGASVWAMECEEGGFDVAVSGGLVDVCFAGSSLGRPALLNGVVDFKKKRWKELGSIPEGDDAVNEKYSMEIVEHLTTDVNEMSSTDFDPHYRADEEEEEEGEEEAEEEEEVLEEVEAQEASWFNAGVRLGVGLGLGMCIGVGVTVGLVVRTYRATSGALRRLI
ncbi:hypothetical protein H6P81_004297 [Aristolochia fimbriata]|uniref:Uncharacterized protein n=1 Tax=Aristolochia fimbriata TaxID=158543 RepID=A0AAV7FGR1_ARIFI|nr:hypothetical protein H6P81_004297 [Aristolochia fimbriata]